jgi:DNA repair exonuclease SbcCD ATPase subunit
MNKLALMAGAVLALSVLTAPAALAQEPADCGAATVALQTAKTDRDKAVDDDEKAEAAKEADRAFDRADRDLRQAQSRLTRAQEAVDEGLPIGGTDAEKKELESAEKAVEDATDERDRARTKADKEDAAQLQRKADRTDADELKRRLDAAQDDVNRLCGGVTTTPPVADDVDCGEVSDDEAQRILDADKSDPNRLDVDGDGIACEDDAVLNPPTVNVVVPSGGVATGGGPA